MYRGKELNNLPQEKELRCRSGEPHFDLRGDVLKGSAESALLAYPLRREGHELVMEV